MLISALEFFFFLILVNKKLQLITIIVFLIFKNDSEKNIT